MQLFQGTVETAFDGIGIFIHDHGDLLQLHIFKETKAYECFLFIRQSRKGFLQICISIGCVDSDLGGLIKETVSRFFRSWLMAVLITIR